MLTSDCNVCTRAPIKNTVGIRCTGPLTDRAGVEQRRNYIDIELQTGPRGELGGPAGAFVYCQHRRAAMSVLQIQVSASFHSTRGAAAAVFPKDVSLWGLNETAIT